jgi:hypothetical protein
VRSTRRLDLNTLSPSYPEEEMWFQGKSPDLLTDMCFEPLAARKGRLFSNTSLLVSSCVSGDLTLNSILSFLRRSGSTLFSFSLFHSSSPAQVQRPGPPLSPLHLCSSRRSLSFRGDPQTLELRGDWEQIESHGPGIQLQLFIYSLFALLGGTCPWFPLPTNALLSPNAPV